LLNGKIMKPSVLVVDDDLGTREVMTTFLHLEGFDGVATANGQEALTYLRGGGHVAVILLDLAMPVMNGWEFRRAQLLDATIARIPVVVVSSEAEAAQAALTPAAWFQKPMDVEQILPVVRALVAATA
jgi:CheY-like chemotaxis protein